jgi:hypothetical protein
MSIDLISSVTDFNVIFIMYLSSISVPTHNHQNMSVDVLVVRLWIFSLTEYDKMGQVTNFICTHTKLPFSLGVWSF